MIRKVAKIVMYEWMDWSGTIRKCDATGRDILKSDLNGKPEIPHLSPFGKIHAKFLKRSKS